MFDKNRCIENIYTLAKKKKLKIGEMEEAAGVSKGYLSRINKEDITTNPPIDFLVSIAEQLGVSMDYLLMYSSDNFKKDESFVIEFVDRVSQKTTRGELEWILQAQSVLTSENDESIDNPLISIVPDYSDDFDMKYMRHEYASHFYSDNVSIIDDCYYCFLPEQIRTRLFIMSVQYYNFIDAPTPSKYHEKESLDVYELYLCTGDKIAPLCSTAYLKEEIGNVIKNLYNTINLTTSRLGLTPNVRAIMQSFLGR